jgi:hypothetical protein
MPLEVESLPHYTFWREELPELVKEVPQQVARVNRSLTAMQGATYFILTLRGLSAVPSRGAYERL